MKLIFNVLSVWIVISFIIMAIVFSIPGQGAILINLNGSLANKICDTSIPLSKEISKSDLSLRLLTFGEKITFVNKALFGKLEQEISYLYSYKPEIVWELWQKENFENGWKALTNNNTVFYQYVGIMENFEEVEQWWRPKEYIIIPIPNNQFRKASVDLKGSKEFNSVINLLSYDSGELEASREAATSRFMIWSSMLCTLKYLSHNDGQVGLYEKYIGHEPEKNFIVNPSNLKNLEEKF